MTSLSIHLKKDQIDAIQTEVAPASVFSHQEDFVKNVLQIALAGKENFARLDEELVKGRGITLPPEALSMLIAQVKEVAPRTDLPNTYCHLIQGLNLSPQNYLNLIPLSKEDNQAFRLACALLEAEKDPKQCASNIEQYGITDEAARIRIAKAIAERSGYVISRHIHLFHITDKQELLNIALSAGAQDWLYVTLNLPKYGFETEELLAIMKSVAVQDVEKLYEILDDFNIQDPDALFAIAKIAAEKNPVLFVQNIEKFGPLDQDKRIALARIATTASKGKISAWISLFKIEDSDARGEIALLSATLNGWDTSMEIKNYTIASEDMRILVAKAAVKNSSTGLIENIDKYCITNQAALIEIAKLVAANDGETLSRCIKKFAIVEERDLLEIAWIAIQQSRDALNYLSNYGLSARVRSLLFSRYYLKTPAAALAFIHHFFPDRQEDIVQLFLPDCRINALEYVFSAWKEGRISLDEAHHSVKRSKVAKTKLLILSCFVSEFSKNSKLIPIIEKLEKEKNPLVLEQKIHEIIHLVLECQLSNISRDTFEALLPTFDSILSLQDADLRASLKAHLIEKLHAPIGKSHPSKAMQLASLLIDPFEKYMTDPITELSFRPNSNRTVSLGFKVVTFQERVEELLKTDFKDDRRLRDLIKDLLVLVETRDLTEEEKWEVLRTLVFVKVPDVSNREQAKQLLEATQSVVQCIQCGKAGIITQVTSRQELHASVKALFSEALGIADSDFESKFFQTIAKWRRSGALLTYANTLNTLPLEERQKVFPSLKKFAQSVLNGTFAAERYAIGDSSIHWQRLFHTNPQLLAAWKQGTRFVGGAVDTDDPCDLLLSGTEVGSCQSVQHRAHESKCLLAYLWDPKIRMMAIKNKAGEITARCMMRLLWDPQIQQFALFQEGVYPKGQLSKTLDDACLERAKQLGVALYRKKKSESDGGVTLQSLGGKAPYEYVDALDGQTHIVTDASYEITGCLCVYTPATS